MASFALAVVAPDRSVVETQVDSVTLPGTEGYFGVWAGHAPLISALRPGILEYSEGPHRHLVVLGGGFVEVTGKRVTVLADSAELAGDVEISKAEAQLEEARKVMRGESSSMSLDDAMHEMEKAYARIKAAKQK